MLCKAVDDLFQKGRDEVKLDDLKEIGNKVRCIMLQAVSLNIIMPFGHTICSICPRSGPVCLKFKLKKKSDF